MTKSKRWADYSWPDWVPEKVREQIESFWAEDWGRGPHTWIQDAADQGAPRFGAVVTLRDGFRSDSPKATGRYVHAWNNIGRLVMDDGSFKYTCFSRSEVAANV